MPSLFPTADAEWGCTEEVSALLHPVNGVLLCLIVCYCGPPTPPVSPSSWQAINKREVSAFGLSPLGAYGPEAAAAQLGAPHRFSVSCVMQTEARTMGSVAEEAGP